jgi:hypothetical protein
MEKVDDYILKREKRLLQMKQYYKNNKETIKEQLYKKQHKDKETIIYLLNNQIMKKVRRTTLEKFNITFDTEKNIYI